MEGFERNVMLNGSVYGYHEVSSIELYVGSYLVIQARSWFDISAFGKSPTEFVTTRLYLYDRTDTITLAEAYDYVKSSEQFVEYVDPNQQALDDILPILTDEQAEQVPQVFPEWAAGKSYALGDRVRYNDILYRCIQAHTSQDGWEPANVASLWTRIGASGEIEEWIQPTGAADAYPKGAKVTHNSKTWVSDVDDNVWEPGVYGWSEVNVG